MPRDTQLAAAPGIQLETVSEGRVLVLPGQ